CLLSIFACIGVVTSFAHRSEAQSLKSGEFSVQRFLPAPGPRNFLTIEGARTEGKMAFSLGLFGNYANDPLLVTTCHIGSDCSNPNSPGNQTIHVISSIFTVDLLASLTPIPRLQLGLRAPFSSVTGDGIQTTGPTAGDASLKGIKGSGLGDPMFEAKVRI